MGEVGLLGGVDHWVQSNFIFFFGGIDYLLKLHCILWALLIIVCSLAWVSLVPSLLGHDATP